MGFPEVKFRIVEIKKCPLYDYGDTFTISGISISMKSEVDNSSITSSVVHTPFNKKKNARYFVLTLTV
jgi:CRP/FNR family cyclic AMP-dependent transcriptional regulator